MMKINDLNIGDLIRFDFRGKIYERTILSLTPEDDHYPIEVEPVVELANLTLFLKEEVLEIITPAIELEKVEFF